MKPETKMHLAMVVTAFFWSGAFIAGKIGVQEFSPYGATFFRFFFATILMFGVLWKKEGQNWKLERSLWPLTIVLGTVGMFGYHILFFTALKYTTAVNSSIIGATNPMITTVLAAIFLKETFNLQRLGAILLALTGVILTATNGKLEVLWNFTFNVGDLIMLGGVFCWAIYSVVGRRVKGRVSSLKLMAHVFLVCLIILIPFMISERIWLQLPQITWQGWFAVLYMAIFPSVLGYLIQMISIQQIGASRTAVYVNLVPAFSMILSFLILHEVIGWFKVFAAGLIIGGVFLSSRFK